MSDQYPPLPEGSLLQEKAIESRNAGVSWANFSDTVNQKWNEARQAGIPDQDTMRYLGFKDPKPIDDRLRDHLKSALAGMEPPTKADGLLEGIQAGLQNSVLGYQWRQALPNVEPGPGFMSHLGTTLGQTVGDLPYMVGGGIVGFAGGAAMGAELGPGAVGTATLGAGAGAMGLPTAIREAYRDGLMNGRIRDPLDFAQRVGRVLMETAKSATEGALATLGGSTAQALATNATSRAVAPMLAGNTSFVATQAALERRLPTFQDFVDAAIPVLAIHGITGAASHGITVMRNLADHWAATGESPADAAARAQHDAEFHNTMMTPPPKLPPPGSATGATIDGEGKFLVPKQQELAEQTEAHETKQEVAVTEATKTAEERLKLTDQGAGERGTVMSLENARGEIGANVAPEVDRMSETWLQKVYRQLWNKDAPVNKLWAAITKGESIPDTDNFKFYRRMEESTGSRARYMIEKNQFDTEGKVIGEGLRSIMKSIPDEHLEDFAKYATAFRARAEIDNGLGSPISRQAAQTFIEHMDSQHGDLFASTVAKLSDYRTNLMKYMRDKEFISQKDFDLYTKDAKYGVPGWREGSAPGASRGGGAAFNPVHEVADNATAKYVDPFTALVKETMLRMQLADRNASNLALMRQAVKAGYATVRNYRSKPPGDEAGVTTLKEGEASYRAGKTENGITDMIEMTDFGAGPDEAIAQMLPYITLRDGDVAVFDNGQRKIVHYEDPMVAFVMRDYDKEAQGALGQAAAAAAKPLRWMTVNNGVFAPVILAMDQMQQAGRPGGFVGRNSAPAAAIVGLFHSFLGTEKFQAAVRAGAVQHVFDYMSNQEITKSILMGEDPTRTTAWNAVQHGLEWWTRSLLNAPSVGRYVIGKTLGESELRASVEGTEAVMHRGGFGGESGRSINRMVPFMLAHLNGMEKTLRNMLTTGETLTGDKYNPGTFALKALAIITMPALADWYFHKDDPRYKALDDWEKYGRLHMGMTSDPGSPLTELQYPPLMGLLFSEVPVRMAQTMFERDPHAWDGFGKSLLRQFTPPGGDTFAPSFIQPVVETVANHSFVTGRPLVSDAQKRVLTQYRYSQYTSPTAQAIAKAAGSVPLLKQEWNPILIDHLLNGYGGRLGQQILRTTENLLGARAENLPPQHWFDNPMARSILSRVPGATAKPTMDFMDRMDRFQEVNNTLVKKMQEGDTEGFKQVLEENPGMAGVQKLHVSRFQRALIPREKLSEFSALLRSDNQNRDMNTLREVLQTQAAVKNASLMANVIGGNKGQIKLKPNDQRALLDQQYITIMNLAEHGNKLLDKVGIK